jgi:hypothetical protein
MSSHGQQPCFRPNVEALEGRCLPAPVTFSFLGNNTPGPWPAGSERIYFFAIEFRGAFTRGVRPANRVAVWARGSHGWGRFSEAWNGARSGRRLARGGGATVS